MSKVMKMITHLLSDTENIEVNQPVKHTKTVQN